MALTALMGTYHHNIDAKGRMSFPTKLRDLLGGEFYVTKSINQKCLTIYSKSEWEKLANKIAELPDSMGGLDIKRWLFSGIIAVSSVNFKVSINLCLNSDKK